jgi:hypothetical protein
MTPRTMTEPEAWREIARQAADDESADIGAHTSRRVYDQMCRRVRDHGMDVPMSSEHIALAALWLALEAEEEGA